MSEATSSPAFAAMQALAARIRHDTPHLCVLCVFERPYPFVQVKDSVHRLVVGFSSKEDFLTYCQLTSRKEAAAYSFRNSLCRDIGHEWALTLADTWRWCRRDYCPISERLVNGEWVSNAPLYRKHQPVVPTGRKPRQAAIWEGEDEQKEARQQ